MFARVGRRALELGVGLFALLGFVFVPLGKKTGFEHLQAIIATPPAKEAARELVEVGDKLKRRVLDGVRTAAEGNGSADTQAKADAGAGAPLRADSLVCAEPVAEVAAHDAPDASVESRVH